MSSKREAILSQVKTALAGTTGVDTRIYRNRVEPLMRSEAPALIVEPAEDNPTENAVGRLIWEFTFKVYVIVRSDTAAEDADAIALDVHSKILGDATLDGLCSGLLPGRTSWGFTSADMTHLAVIMEFTTMYQTQTASLST